MNNTNKNPSTFVNGFSFGGATRNRTGDKGFADPCLTAWLWRIKPCIIRFFRFSQFSKTIRETKLETNYSPILLVLLLYHKIIILSTKTKQISSKIEHLWNIFWSSFDQLWITFLKSMSTIIVTFEISLFGIICV